MKYSVWQIGASAPEAGRALRTAGIPPLLAEILVARGYDTPAAAQEFLESVRAPLPDPLLMSDMTAARDRVRRALAHGERICVFGDYDVDGITATCLLTEYLRSRGGNVTPYIPDRLDEGYGLSAAALERLQADGVQLVVTVDCGVTAVEEAQVCRRLGLELVVTDHHTCGETLPDAVAVVDPHRPDDSYPFKGLAGVGVAFKLASAVEGDQAALLERYGDLLALGTVADVMPLQGENRAMVAGGIEALRSHPRLGLRALMTQSGANISSGSTAIGYTLAPRINAAGRMGNVMTALQLLMTRDPAEAEALSSALCALNRERQSVEQAIYAAVRSELGEQTPEAVVLANADWHQGVLGIVASRISEEYHCPTCLISLDGEVGKASSRSYGGFSLICALQKLSPLLERYGGHQLAAGFTIRAEHIDEFREALCALVREHRAIAPTPPSLQLDCRISDPSLLTLEQVEALNALEPCGADCPKPLLCVDNLTVLQADDVGGGKHLRLRMRLGRTVIQGIFFSMTALRAGVSPGDVIEVAATPQVNEFCGTRTVQLQLTDLRLADAERSVRDEELRLYERHRNGEMLTAAEAAALLPPRAEFAAVWRYLKANAQSGVLLEEPDCLSRKIARSVGSPTSYMRTRICLDVFHECGLLRLSCRREQYEIRLQDDGRRVNLSSSPIMAALQKCADREQSPAGI